jgi:hypothetical protein
MNITFFESLENVRPQLREMSWQSVCNYFTPHCPPVFNQEERKLNGRRFSFNIYKSGTTRKKDNVSLMTGLVLDFDNKDEFVPIADVLMRVQRHNLIHLWYSTWSDTPTLPRWRLIIPFLTPISVSEWKPLYDQMIILLGNPPGIDHQASVDVSRVWASPCVREGGIFKAEAYRMGSFLDAQRADQLLTSAQKAQYDQQQIKKPVQKYDTYSFNDFPDIQHSDLTNMLEVISADCDYGTWIRIGMSLHEHLGGTTQGFNLWNNWSRCSKKFPGENTLLAHWRSFSMKGNGVGIGTLIHYARENGYERFPKTYIAQKPSFAGSRGAMEQGTDLRKYDAPEEVFPTTPAFNMPPQDEAIEVVAASEEIGNPELFDFSEFVKKDILDFPTIFLKETYGFLLNSASYINPLYALSSTIVLGGFLLRKLISKKGREESHTNFMTLAIGQSGTGKTQILKGVQKILTELDQEKHYTHSLGTIQGALEVIKQQKGSMFLIQDEASYVFKAMKNRNISVHEMFIEKFKLEMFSMPDFYTPPATKSSDMTPIKNPFFCEISFSTPDIMKYLSPEDYGKGLLPRYLVFHETSTNRIPNPTRNLIVSEDLKLLLREYSTISFQFSPGVVFDTAADAALTKFKEKIDETRSLILEREDHHYLMMDATLGRVLEHAAKLSLLGAERRSGSYVITQQAVEWGIAVSVHSFNTLIAMIENGIYENQIEEMRARVLGIVEKVSNGEWVPKCKISRNIKFLTAKQLTDHLFKLNEEEVIQIQATQKNYLKIKSNKRKAKKKA